MRLGETRCSIQTDPLSDAPGGGGHPMRGFLKTLHQTQKSGVFVFSGQRQFFCDFPHKNSICLIQGLFLCVISPLLSSSFIHRWEVHFCPHQILFKHLVSESSSFHREFDSFRACETAAIGGCELQRPRIQSVYRESAQLQDAVDYIVNNSKC